MPTEPGTKKKKDSEYARKGTCSIFVFNEPLAGLKHTSVRKQRTAMDWAEETKELVDSSPDVEKILLVMDNQNTHATTSLYKTFIHEEARRIKERIEIHYTPKHRSWLDMVEIELNIMTIQFMNRRIDYIDRARSELSAGETMQNNAKRKIW